METAIRQKARTERANYMCPGMHFGLLMRFSRRLAAGPGRS